MVLTSNDFLSMSRLKLVQINSTERDSGVLCGNWSGKYDDGVSPYAWNGSSAILEEFLKKRKGVKYGQCWTFAAVATTSEKIFNAVIMHPSVLQIHILASKYFIY